MSDLSGLVEATQELIKLENTQVATKTNKNSINCYDKADPNEPLFTLLGRDRHGSGLVELWALMREKEGESPENVREARECAAAMAEEARKRGKPVLSLEAIVSFCSTLKQEQADGNKAEESSALEAITIAPIAEGNIVVVGGGRVCKVVKIYGSEDDERVRGLANVTFPKASGHATVSIASMRHASIEEITAFRNLGGK